MEQMRAHFSEKTLKNIKKQQISYDLCLWPPWKDGALGQKILCQNNLIDIFLTKIFNKPESSNMNTVTTKLVFKVIKSSTFFLLSLVSIIVIQKSDSQTWCTPAITQTFNQGISSVTLNGTPPLERVSGRNDLYINTGMSTTLNRNQTYTISIVQGFGAFCTAGNLRVWIDYNRDYDFDDAGETVLSLDQQFSTGPFTVNFTVPGNAFIGTTRMRVSSKMREQCGHIATSPCNDPPDPAGFHGEMEDYEVIIIQPTAITSISETIPEKFELYQNYPNPFNPVTNINFDITKDSKVNITVYDLNGKEMEVLVNEELSAGSYKADWDAGNYSSGIYYYRITVLESSTGKEYFAKTHKMVLVK